MYQAGSNGHAIYKSALKYSKNLLLLVSMFMPMLATNAAAEESKRTWTLLDQDGQTHGPYKTQDQAAASIKNLPDPSPYIPGFYKYADQIKNREISQNGDLKITYWNGKEQPTDPEWEYPVGTQDYATEDEAVKELESIANASNSPCPATAKLTLLGDWNYSRTGPGDDGGEWGKKPYQLDYTRRSGSDCVPQSSTSELARHRKTECSTEKFMTWRDKYQACVNEYALAFVVTKTLERGCGYEGNPCDTKTGDKYQIETDFDLGWIAFERHYHSGISNVSGGFGYGWTHSHDLRLSIADDSLGLTDGGGFHTRYRKSGDAYFASDSSGNRIVADGGLWKLYRADSVLTFDADGRLLERNNQDGTSLSYDYDAMGRLSAILHSSGRTLELHYNSSAENASIVAVSASGVQLVSYTYTATGQVGTATYPGGGNRAYHYEDTRYPKNLTGITAEDGRRYSWFAYDDEGRVISSQHDGGADGITLSYTPAGGAIVTDALGHQTNYGLAAGTASGPPRKIGDVVDSEGTLSTTYYDESVDFRRRVDTVIDRSGVQTKHSYAEAVDSISGLPASTHTAQQAVGLSGARDSVETRDLASNRVILTRDTNRETRFTRNARLQPTSAVVKDITNGKLRTTTYSYCEADDVASGGSCPLLGLLKSVDGPRTDVSDSASYAYYPSDDATCATAPAACPHRKGDLWKVTNAMGQVTEYLSYDGAGRPLSVKDANGTITDYTYHPRGWLTASKVRGADDSSETDDRITRIDYWPTGLVKQVTQPDGAFTAFTYDAAHRLTDIADNAGNTLHYTLDNAGNRVKEDTKDASGTLKRTLSRVYNQLGQLATQATASGDPTDFGYDANGNTKTVTDALSHVTQNDYDPLNRLARTLQDVGGIAAETKFGYDALDNLTKVTDPKGLDTTYAYSGLGDLTKLTSPDTGVTTYTYDSAGNRATQTDARNIKTTYSYDALNRLTKVAYPTSSLNVTYTYDVSQTVCASGETYAVGRLSRMQDSSGSTDYCYDRFGDLVRKVQTTNGKVFVLRYTYTKAGQLSRLIYPDGAAVDYVRNAQGQTTEVGVTPAGGTRQVLLGNATYYPFGPVASWSYGNGRPMQRVLDQDYRPLAVSDTRSDGLSTGFAFDPAGNLSALTAAGNTAPIVSLDYDALGRLTAFKDGPTGTVIDGYSYDATGNRLSAKVNTTTQTYTYPTSSHRLDAVAATARTYDAMGNTTSIGGTALQFVYGASGRIGQAKRAGTVVMNYAYNGRGEQVRRSGKTNTYTLYDETGHWLGDYDNNGAALQQAIWLDDLPVGVLAKSSLRYVQPDHLGSPRAVIDPVRDVAIWTWDLKGEAFGNTSPDQDPDKDGTAFVFDMRFPGQRYDAATGFNQNYFRDYDPSTGRYGQSDPIGLIGGTSTYLYSLGTPTRLYDPLGLEAVWDTKTCAGQLGLTTCDGKGGFMVSNCNNGCDRECTQRHEEEHKRFLQTVHPGACLGRPLGAAPWPQTYSADSAAYAREFHETECRADAITIDCISKLRKNIPLDANAKRNLLEATKRRESRKCEDYGF